MMLSVHVQTRVISVIFTLIFVFDEALLVSSESIESAVRRNTHLF